MSEMVFKMKRPSGRVSLPDEGNAATPVPTLERALPTVRRQVVNFASEALDVVQYWMATGEVRASAEVMERRLRGDGSRGGCTNRYGEGKPCGYFRPSDERCAHPRCGCFANAKVWFAGARCADGVWAAAQ